MVTFEKIFSGTSSIIKAKLHKGESIKAVSGAMISMTDTFDVKLNSGGFKKAFGRMFSGQSTFLVEYTAKTDGEIMLSPSFLGEIEFIDLERGKEYTLGQYALLALEGNVDLNNKMKGGKGFLSGEGVFQVDVKGEGILALTAYGKIIKKELALGEKFIIDTNHLVLRDKSIDYKVEWISDGITSFASGEGYVMKFTGPGVVWYQSKNPSYLSTPTT
ncbi:MAG: TIGR00266 family protein [Sarcina sp.]